MGELVNINKIRKQVAQRQAAARAAENRLMHGRTRVEKMREEAMAAKARRDLEGHRTSKPGDEQ
jgi:hypothetical protein